jgi:hemerythrin superfamily protein
MGVLIDAGNDVAIFLTAQHEQEKILFARVLDSHGEARKRDFTALRRLLAVHEAAEETIVHPAVSVGLPDGDQVIQARLAEELMCKTMLVELETLPVDAPEFDRRLHAFQATLLQHAEAEEQEEFPRLGRVLDAAKLAHMRKAALLAEAVAPTRPHPGVESAAANLVAGPFLSMLDRTRDVLAGKV